MADEPTVRDLAPLVGEWSVRVEADWAEGEGPIGRTTFEWLSGETFLVQRWTVDIEVAPDGIAVLGLDEASGGLQQHYFDSRGVARTYGTSLTDGVWKLWRYDADFSQRFAGRFDADGQTIAGAWETGTPDGWSWTHDFDLTYTKES